jgi:hypothetical protein
MATSILDARGDEVGEARDSRKKKFDELMEQMATPLTLPPQDADDAGEETGDCHHPWERYIASSMRDVHRVPCACLLIGRRVHEGWSTRAGLLPSS